MQDTKHVVLCTTQEEFDYVISKFNPRNLLSHYFEDYKEKTFIVYRGYSPGYYGNMDYSVAQLEKITSFQEWCKECNHVGLTKASKEFVLPEKWCIKITKGNCQVLGNWRDVGFLYIDDFSEDCYLYTPMDGKKGYFLKGPIEKGYTEITFEQFKQYVLNVPSKNTYKVGDRVITKGYHSEYEGKVLEITQIVDEEYCRFKLVNEDRDTGSDNFRIRKIERFARPDEIITQPVIANVKSYSKPVEEPVSSFKKGDYIVKRTPNKTQFLHYNHVYVQSQDSACLRTATDNYGRRTSSADVYFTRKQTWRYATEKEIDHYNFIGKPFNVELVSENLSEDISDNYKTSEVKNTKSNLAVNTEVGYACLNYVPKFKF